MSAAEIRSGIGSRLPAWAGAVAHRVLAARPVWRLLRSGLPNGLGLMYHRISGPDAVFPGLGVQVFRAQMRWLRDNCTILDPDSLPFRELPHGALKPAVVVTFDDGYRDYHDHAYPVLRELGIPSLVFLSTGFMDDPKKLLWSDRLYLGVQRARRQECALPWQPERTFQLSDAPSRAAFLRVCKRHLKTLPEADKDAQGDAVLAALDATPIDVGRQMLDWSEVRRCSDLTRWGGHTHSHRILSRLSPEQSEIEIATCRERIVAETARATRLFAYPNGQIEDFGEVTQAQLRKHGFDVALTPMDGSWGGSTDWMAVPRLSGDTTTAAALAWRIAMAPR